jgi:hypothetical protein
MCDAAYMNLTTLPTSRRRRVANYAPSAVEVRLKVGNGQRLVRPSLIAGELIAPDPGTNRGAGRRR